MLAEQVISLSLTIVALVVITTAQLYSTKPELRLWGGSNPGHGVSEIQDGENL